MIVNKWLYRRLPYFLRKRITPQQSPFIVVVALAILVIFLQTLSMLTSEPSDLKYLRNAEAKLKRKPLLSKIIGVDTKLRHLYVPNEDNLFKCMSSNKMIPFEWINDNFCDCDLDGSDEPGTEACQNGRFYCSYNTKSSPTWIISSRVNDGICDCCDGSDEWRENKVLDTLSNSEQKKLHRFQTPCQDICHHDR